jgi:hypothetical protein
MYSVFRPNLPTELLPEFIIFALWEHERLTMSQLCGIIPQIEKPWIVKVIQDLRDHGLIARDGSALILTDDGRGHRETMHVPQWYFDKDEDHLWHPLWDHLDGLNLAENMSPFELKIVAIKHPFRTSEASEIIQFSSFQILRGLEQGGYLRRS